jgi:hypothetical protein
MLNKVYVLLCITSVLIFGCSQDINEPSVHDIDLRSNITKRLSKGNL